MCATTVYDVRTTVRARLVIGAVLLTLGLPSDTAAQRATGAPAPSRPALGGQVDTNDPQAYYELGFQSLRREPKKAAAAFYWASRLDPVNAEVFHGRRIAFFLSDQGRFLDYLADHRKTLSDPEVIAADSLEMDALTRDPFFPRRLSMAAIQEAIIHLARQYARQRGEDFNEALLAYYVREYLDSGSPVTSASLAMAEERYGFAVKMWDRAARERPKGLWIRAELARALAMDGKFTEAIGVFTQALDTLKVVDHNWAIRSYETRALWQFSIAILHLRLSDTLAARQAFQQTILEDRAYYSAYIRLAMLHVAAGDTANASAEFKRAMRANPNAYQPRLAYGHYLLQLARSQEAQVELARAVELEPYAAVPQLLLARARDTGQDIANAITAYERFLTIAARRDPRRAAVADRIAELSRLLGHPSPAKTDSASPARSPTP
jgi:tetratricopeptide (TPR) repeat protein